MNPVEILHDTIIRIDGAYAPATIRAYVADFKAFIVFCESRNEPALPASSLSVAAFIVFMSATGRSSASIRRAIVGISALHLLNRLPDPSKEPEVRLAMKRMHRSIGRSSNQAFGIRQEMLTRMLGSLDGSLRGLRDAVLIQLAYDTLCRRSELVSLLALDLAQREANGIHHSILLRKSKVDQELRGRWIALQTQTVASIECWCDAAKITDGFLLRGVDHWGKVTESLSGSQINRIYKRIAMASNLDTTMIKKISGHSFRIGAAQDLLASGASMPTIMNRGRWSKSDTVMRYLEQYQVMK
ncbi:tyrosine-type recombinase/integrase [Polynucleobacter antarcticus]|uniref:Site-specific recombinase XerD n=1 Tax=Polynucleobacter antarcticus TaxID=1743162 RepID=A0A6M9PIB4_9BURK|nr:tyrosine-type recombinase/integrase [Polynucleobacter antarcticus]QKM61894.1 hypothetical protein DCO16_01620 [Polynucleobacter antarcticus]